MHMSAYRFCPGTHARTHTHTRARAHVSDRPLQLAPIVQAVCIRRPCRRMLIRNEGCPSFDEAKLLPTTLFTYVRFNLGCGESVAPGVRTLVSPHQSYQDQEVVLSSLKRKAKHLQPLARCR